MGWTCPTSIASTTRTLRSSTTPQCGRSASGWLDRARILGQPVGLDGADPAERNGAGSRAGTLAEEREDWESGMGDWPPGERGTRPLGVNLALAGLALPCGSG